VPKGMLHRWKGINLEPGTKAFAEREAYEEAERERDNLAKRDWNADVSNDGKDDSTPGESAKTPAEIEDDEVEALTEELKKSVFENAEEEDGDGLAKET